MKKQKGFTLIELMIVMAIIAVLATAGIQAYTNYLKNARDSVRLSIASQVETAVTALMTSNGGVPPDDGELLAELERMNMTTAMNSIVPQESLYLSALSDTLENIIGAPALFGQTTSKIKEPSGGRPICLGYDNISSAVIGGQSCAFHYIVYSDNTYVVGYGVETESNMKKNFYKVATTDMGTGNGAPKYMQVKGTAQYVGKPSIGEPDGPLRTTTTPFTVSKVVVAENGAVENNDTASIIVGGKSGFLSAEIITPGSITDGGSCTNNVDCTNGNCTAGVCVAPDLCEGSCQAGQICNISAACVYVCGETECQVGQTCGASNTCINLCGGNECQAGEECVADACVTPDPCPIKTPGEGCTGGTKYAGDYLGYHYMTTSSDLGSYAWGPLYVTTGITGWDNGADNTASLVALIPSYPAAEQCDNLNSGGFSDWFLPAHSEIATLLVPNKTNIGGFTTTSGYPDGGWYWSSSEATHTYGLMDGFMTGAFPNQWSEKNISLKVRCMRKYQ